MLDTDALDHTLAEVRRRLMAFRLPSGHWEGELSPSALSTALAASALTLADREAHQALVQRGLDWLAANQNTDGGWGDTALSASNISTTALCWAAFAIAADSPSAYRDAGARAEGWLTRAAGGLAPEQLAKAIAARYGKDRTFSAPTLTVCAIAGKLGAGSEGWRWVMPLPFELAACPHRWLRWLRLPVVSYALPALIAIGQARYRHRPPLNPVARLLRRLTRRKTLDVLRGIQPESGGFLEAVPLTSFVVLSLVAGGEAGHPVVSKGVGFLTGAVRADGAWPIDKNLATWVTTLSVNALAASPRFPKELSCEEREAIRDWLLSQQHREEHPFTHAEPGGWAWTDLPGGVPDADDTAGALLALRHLGPHDERALDAVAAGINWLLGLQNRDGGIPTFCRGWGALPFDRSAPDLTAHALHAMAAWLDGLSPSPSRASLRERAEKGLSAGLSYLAQAQRQDGSWVPLWFGNEGAPGEENPTYGTARVVMALSELVARSPSQIEPMLAKGARWLLAARSPDGGWGGAPSAPPTIEETALAVDALARLLPDPSRGPALSEAEGFQSPREGMPEREPLEAAILAGANWLIERTDRGRSVKPSPIGLYFAKLWYFEVLYPLIFTVSALGRVRASARPSPHHSLHCVPSVPL